MPTVLPLFNSAMGSLWLCVIGLWCWGLWGYSAPKKTVLLRWEGNDHSFLGFAKHHFYRLFEEGKDNHGEVLH